MKLRYPFAEPPYSCEHLHYRPSLRRSAMRLAHYELDNGYTVSILQVDTGGCAPLWEAWAWPTELGADHALTAKPTYHDSAVAALGYRNAIAGRPTPHRVNGVLQMPAMTPEQVRKLRADFERPYGR